MGTIYRSFQTIRIYDYLPQFHDPAKKALKDKIQSDYAGLVGTDVISMAWNVVMQQVLGHVTSSSHCLHFLILSGNPNSQVLKNKSNILLKLFKTFRFAFQIQIHRGKNLLRELHSAVNGIASTITIDLLENN